MEAKVPTMGSSADLMVALWIILTDIQMCQSNQQSCWTGPPQIPDSADVKAENICPADTQKLHQNYQQRDICSTHKGPNGKKKLSALCEKQSEDFTSKTGGHMSPLEN